MWTYTTSTDKEELLDSAIRSVENCLQRITPNRPILHVAQAFKDNIHKARIADTTERKLHFARLAMPTWSPASHSTGVGIGNLAQNRRRSVLEDRVEVLRSILDNWHVHTPWTMRDGILSFNSHTRHTRPHQPPGPQLSHMLLQLKQLSS